VGSRSIYHILINNISYFNQTTANVYSVYAILSRFDSVVEFMQARGQFYESVLVVSYGQNLIH
jgi:hypothetical protein